MNIELICNKIGMSRTKLYSKVKDLTGQPIGDFIRTIRLKTALQLMTEQQMPIAEVMYQVGIQTQSYFTKAFKNEFGKTPMQFLKELKGEGLGNEGLGEAQRAKAQRHKVFSLHSLFTPNHSVPLPLRLY
jgi:AraC-like DNA-binding protein